MKAEHPLREQHACVLTAREFPPAGEFENCLQVEQIFRGSRLPLPDTRLVERPRLKINIRPTQPSNLLLRVRDIGRRRRLEDGADDVLVPLVDRLRRKHESEEIPRMTACVKSPMSTRQVGNCENPTWNLSMLRAGLRWAQPPQENW